MKENGVGAKAFLRVLTKGTHLTPGIQRANSQAAWSTHGEGLGPGEVFNSLGSNRPGWGNIVFFVFNQSLFLFHICFHGFLYFFPQTVEICNFM